jgi:hypothetical protein
MLGDMKGKLGNITFSRNKAGKIVRQNVKSVDSNSNAQRSERDLFSKSRSEWASLSDQEKSFYRTEAFTHGNKLNGYQYFMSLNLTQLINPINFVKFSGIITRSDLMNCNVVPISIIQPALQGFIRVISSITTYPVCYPCNYYSNSNLYIYSNIFISIGLGCAIFRNIIYDNSDAQNLARMYSVQTKYSSSEFSDQANSGYSIFSTEQIQDSCYADLVGDGSFCTVNCLYGAAHGYTGGESVTVSNSTHYDGTHTVIYIDQTSFKFSTALSNTDTNCIITTLSSDLVYYITCIDIPI